MVEYIKREDAIEICTKCVDFQDSIENINASAEAGRIRRLIRKLPSADVIERKQGKWNWVNFNIECSECGAMPNFDSTEPLYNFCPNCGARMESEGEDE